MKRTARSWGQGSVGTFSGGEGPDLIRAFINIETTGSLSPSGPVGLVTIHMLSLEEPQREGLTVSGVRVVAADGVFSPLLFHLQQKAGPIIYTGGLGSPQSLRKSPVTYLPALTLLQQKNENKPSPPPPHPPWGGWGRGEEAASPPIP